MQNDVVKILHYRLGNRMYVGRAQVAQYEVKMKMMPMYPTARRDLQSAT